MKKLPQPPGTSRKGPQRTLAPRSRVRSRSRTRAGGAALGDPGACRERGAWLAVAVQSPAAARSSSGTRLSLHLPGTRPVPFSVRACERSCASRRSTGKCPGALLSPVSSPLFSWQNAQYLRESLVPRQRGRMEFSTTLQAAAVLPGEATLSDGLFLSGCLLPPRRCPLPPPLSQFGSLSLL